MSERSLFTLFWSGEGSVFFCRKVPLQKNAMPEGKARADVFAASKILLHINILAETASEAEKLIVAIYFLAQG